MCALVACTPMDHYYSQFIPEADIIYPGKVDSVQVLPGYKRAIIDCQLSSDPKVVKLKVYWQNRQDSIERAITHSEVGKRIKIPINPMAEGSYNFEVITFDAQNNSSVRSEAFGKIYGDTYRGNLNNRIISSTGFGDDGNAFIDWIPEISTDIIGTEVQYIGEDNKLMTIDVPRDEEKTVLSGYKIGTKVRYRAIYLPVSAAIDTLYTDFSETSLNIAFKKSVTASDVLTPGSAAQMPKNAVDGKRDISDPRWVSTGSGEHWLEIDLEAEHFVHGFKT